MALWMAQDAEDEIRRLSRRGSDFKAETSRRYSTVIPRNLPITSPLVKLDSFTYNGIPLAQKVYLELEDRDFLRVVHIIQDTSTSEVTLRGWRFRRTKELNGVIEKKLNEVCWILHIDDDDPRDPKLQGMETVPVSHIVKRRRIRLTNQSFPALSWRDDGKNGKREPIETVENDRVLVCRFKYLCFYADAKARAAYEWHEKGFHRLREDECDQRPDNKTKDEELRSIWRGYTAPGGSQEGWLPGEKEFLRQEDVCHRGIASCASLKVPSGPDFPMGDPMKRGSVGSLVTEIDLQRSSDHASQSGSFGSNDPAHMDSGARIINDVEEAPMSSTSREQRQGGQKPHFNFSGFNGLPVVSSDCDTDDDDTISALRRGLRRSSIQSRKPMDRSRRIVEIEAHIKTSSSSGTFENRYEGRVTSRYYPPRLARRKRAADISLDSPPRPTKKIDRGFRAESSQAELRNVDDGRDSRTLPSIFRYSHQASASSDSDKTLGRSQSPDSVEEVYTTSELCGYKTAINGLLTPVSRRMDSTPRRSSGIGLPPSMGDFAGYSQPSMTLLRTARSSVTNKTQAYPTTEEDDDIVDLTRPQANPHESSSRAQSSAIGQLDRSDPLYAQPVLSSHLSKTSSLSKKSFQPTFAQPPSNSKPYWTSAETRQELNRIDLRPLPVTRRSSQANRISSSPSSKASARPSSRHSERSWQQNQNKTIKSPASKANQRRYTFGDCFCGAGGMSRGAVSAGLRVGWGFDFSLPACKSYQMNFFRTPIYNVWADQFSEAKGDHKVDICHLSPPCQFFSSAHTIQGKDDDMNTASLFAIFNLLDKVKPRIVTLEQTSGLIDRHPIFFNTVINMFTSRGFSIRWKVMNCADFGLPQRRTRLFVIASW